MTRAFRLRCSPAIQALFFFCCFECRVLSKSIRFEETKRLSFEGEMRRPPQSTNLGDMFCVGLPEQYQNQRGRHWLRFYPLSFLLASLDVLCFGWFLLYLRFSFSFPLVSCFAWVRQFCAPANMAASWACKRTGMQNAGNGKAT